MVKCPQTVPLLLGGPSQGLKAEVKGPGELVCSYSTVQCVLHASLEATKTIWKTECTPGHISQCFLMTGQCCATQIMPFYGDVLAPKKANFSETHCFS